MAPCHFLLSLGLLAIVQGQPNGAPCSCGGQTPCQHNSGFTCHALVGTETGLRCPVDTKHCACPCTHAQPCQLNGVCGHAMPMYGKDVCTGNAVHCRSPHMKLSTHGTCKCAGQRPCLVTNTTTGIRKGECTASGPDGHCATGSERCVCKCPRSTPCQVTDTFINAGDCLALDEAGSCPDSAVRCEHDDTPMDRPGGGLALPSNCHCGGGKPCQGGDGTCVELQMHDGGWPRCPALTTKCDCNCDDEDHPCKYVDSTGNSYCFKVLDNVDSCPTGTAKCIVTPPTPTASLAAAVPTPAPFLPIHTTIVTAADLETPTPVPDSQTSNGGKNCVFDGWTEWSACTRLCGGGQQTRSPRVTQLPSGGGVHCPKNQARECATKPCNNIDCTVSGWTEWSECSVHGTRGAKHVECGNGLKTSSPIISVNASDYGARCPPPRQETCNTGPCYKELPRCECDPFASYTDSSTQIDQSAKVVYAIRGPHGYDATKTTKNTDSIECTVDPETKLVKVTHPNNFLALANKTEQAGGLHVCKHKENECRCCKCHSLQCHETRWGAWTDCQYLEGSTPARTRARQVEGKTIIGGHCTSITETALCMTR